MGPELALLLAAGGTAASMRGEQVAANQRRSRLNDAMKITSDAQDRTQAAITNEGNNLDPTKRLQTMNDQAATAQQAISTNLNGAGATDASGNAIINTAGDNGAVSKEYLAAKADKALTEGSRLTALAKAAARSRAPGQMAQDESQRRASLMGDVGSQWSTARNLSNAKQQDAASIQTPWWGKVGKIAQAVGMAALSGGAGAAGAGTAAVEGAGGYGLSGASLGEMGASSPGGFWSNAGRIRF